MTIWVVTYRGGIKAFDTQRAAQTAAKRLYASVVHPAELVASRKCKRCGGVLAVGEVPKMPEAHFGEIHHQYCPVYIS